MYSKAAMRMFVKKSMPMRKKRKPKTLKPDPPRKRSPRLFVVVTGRDVAGLTPDCLMISPTVMGIIDMIDSYGLYNPGMARRLIPIRLRRIMDVSMNTRPIIAEVIISLPAFSFSGMPFEVVTRKMPTRMRRRAMPPPRPMRKVTREPTKPPDSMSVDIQPMAVSISLLLGQPP